MDHCKLPPAPYWWLHAHAYSTSLGIECQANQTSQTAEGRHREPPIASSRHPHILIGTNLGP